MFKTILNMFKTDKDDQLEANKIEKDQMIVKFRDSLHEAKDIGLDGIVLAFDLADNHFHVLNAKSLDTETIIRLLRGCAYTLEQCYPPDENYYN